jgi:hypothetical protein
MIKMLTRLIQMILLTNIFMIVPLTASAMTIDEYYYPTSQEIQFVVHQTEGNIAGFAVANSSYNQYSGAWIDNGYAGSWDAFRAIKDIKGNWINNTNNDPVDWLYGWGIGESHAFVYCDHQLNTWWNITQGTTPSEGDPLPTLNYLGEETVSGWWGSANVPYSPFTAIGIGEGAEFSMAAGETTEHVVPIPAAAFLFGSGLIGLIGIRRKISAITSREA